MALSCGLLAITTTLIGCVGGANESTPTHATQGDAVAIVPVPTARGEAGAGLGLWAYYGTFDGQHLELPTPVRDVPSTDVPQSGAVVPRLRRDGPTPEALDGDAVSRFLAGFGAAGGDPDYARHLVNDVIPCEYGWQPYVRENGYMSRAQFAPDSWAKAGGGDMHDDFTVGRNVANWIGMIADPGSVSGWPVCWHRGGWQ